MLKFFSCRAITLKRFSLRAVPHLPQLGSSVRGYLVCLLDINLILMSMPSYSFCPSFAYILSATFQTFSKMTAWEHLGGLSELQTPFWISSATPF